MLIEASANYVSYVQNRRQRELQEVMVGGGGRRELVVGIMMKLNIKNPLTDVERSKLY